LDSYHAEVLMKLRAKGQLTLPIEIREHLGLHEGDEVEFEIHDNVVHLTRARVNQSHGRRIASRLRGRGSSGMSTEEIMDLLRGED
jgi:AbrB family looped-hinge helix DNA binding protein